MDSWKWREFGIWGDFKMRENRVKKENEIREVRNFEWKRESVMFVYELMIRREDEGKETAEEEKQILTLLRFSFGFFVVILCVYIYRWGRFVFVLVFGFLFTCLGFLSFLSIKSQLYVCCGMWLDLYLHAIYGIYFVNLGLAI